MVRLGEAEQDAGHRAGGRGRWVGVQRGGWGTWGSWGRGGELPDHVNVPHAPECTLKNGQNGQFYVVSLLPNAQNTF